ncbi:MAG: sigma-70 family RNA polymerase sigma factor [Gemmatimonadota bacterium]
MDYAALTDLDLVPLAARGREGAFREILERYQRPVFSLIFRMVRDRELAEDLAQEAFVRAFNALEGFNPKYKFSSWLFKIANNLTIDHLRKRTLDTVSIDGAPDAVSADEQAGSRIAVEDSSERPDAFVENRELGGRIETAIGGLRPEYRTAVLLRHVEGYSYEEMADIMEVPLGTVKTFLHRARAELKEQLAGIHGE